MGDRSLWLFINSFAGWLSALGTIAAVIVALYLARRDSRIRLKVVVGLRLLLQRDAAERPEFFDRDVAPRTELPRVQLLLGNRNVRKVLYDRADLDRLVELSRIV